MRKLISLIIVFVTLISCDSSQKNSEETENIARKFLELISEKKFKTAGKMIDSKSVYFSNRNKLMKEIQFDSLKGNLKEFMIPHFGGVSHTTQKGFFYSKSAVSFSLQVKYEKDTYFDHNSIHFVVIDYGKGWLINEFIKSK